MTNILIPTDFSAGSVKLAEQALQSVRVNSVNVVFFHLFELPYSEFDLLDPSRKKPYSDVMTDAFRQSCKQLKEQHSKSIQKICFKFLEGNSVPLFRNFVEANEIDLIYCPEHYVFTPVHKLSVDPRQVFRKCGIPIICGAVPEVIFEDTREEVLQPVPMLLPVGQ